MHSYLSIYLSGDHKARNIITRNFFLHMIENFDKTISKDNAGLKWDMNSGHDSNLDMFMPTLNLTTSECIY